MTKLRPIRRILPRAPRTKLAMTAVAAVTAAGLATFAMSGAGPAQAFDGPNDHHQFVRYNNKSSVISHVRMWLYDASGALVYKWRSDTHDSQTWWYTRGGGHLTFEIKRYNPTNGVYIDTHSWDIGPNDADGQCYLIPDGRDPRFTGDSATGGCTPD